VFAVPKPCRVRSRGRCWPSSRSSTSARASSLVAKGLDQRRPLHAAWAKAGAAVELTRPDPRAIAPWVGTLARERGHAVAPAAVELLLERVGADLARLDDEIEKLSLHVGPGATIDAKQVDALVATTRARAVEELTDRLARRDLAGAIRALRGLVAGGEAPLRILAFLASNLRRALHVSELAASGATEAEIASRLGMPPWLVSKQTKPRDAGGTRSGAGDALRARRGAQDVTPGRGGVRERGAGDRGVAAGRPRGVSSRARATARERRAIFREAAFRWMTPLLAALDSAFDAVASVAAASFGSFFSTDARTDRTM